MKTDRNNFVRFLIVILGFSILGLAFSSFFLSEPKYEISTGIVTLISITLVLFLSESFNQLSIGKLIKLSKEVEKKEELNKEIKAENSELRGQLLNIVTNVQQSQVNNTFNTPPEAWLKLLGVVQSENSNDDDENEEVENTIDEFTPIRDASANRSSYRRRRFALKAGLQQYATALPLFTAQYRERVEFSSAFHAIDPIMDKRVIFDGYIEQDGVELFIEIRHKTMSSPMYFDRLYVLLSKIDLYRKAKKVNAELLLLLVSTPFEDENRRDHHHRLLDYFQPAIQSGLLRIEYIDVSEEEVNTIEEEYNQRRGTN